MKLSLQQWSLHRELFGESKKDYARWQHWLTTEPEKVLQGSLDPLDFPSVARELGFEAVEYVNTFFYRKDDAYFHELKRHSENAGVKNLLVMVDEEGFLGDPDAVARKESIQRHVRWLNVASILGCRSIRVNAHSRGTKEDQQKWATDGLAQLCDLAKPMGLDILIENHGGMSSNPHWLIQTIEDTGKSNIGTMVDFGNFAYSENKIWDGEHEFDIYEGVSLLMPYAKAVSAKAFAFDESGNEENIDFDKMFQIIKKSNYTGYIGVEFEGESLAERKGIKATKRLVEKYL